MRNRLEPTDKAMLVFEQVQTVHPAWNKSSSLLHQATHEIGIGDVTAGSMPLIQGGFSGKFNWYRHGEFPKECAPMPAVGNS